MKNFTFFFLLSLFFSACVEKEPECPLSKGEWEYISEWSDEFNGNTLDTTKWYPRNPGWKGRKPGYFSPANVSVKDGKMILTSKTEDLPDLPEGYHTFTTAAVKSKAFMLYGYYEIRFKPMDSRCSSAFWFYSIEPDLWTEIDVFEICGKHPTPEMEQKYFMTVHVMKHPEVKEKTKSSELWETPSRLANQFWIAGLEWDEKEIKWYLNGELIRVKQNKYWHQPLNMNFDSETFPSWFGLPDPKDPAGHFEVDYVRVWKRKE
ncbi:family 16 glycosylhydrolase [Maribellus maritimus]|uniref:family 16 glycosylhydrolase n=1 Tax=Maribellus maritimus TaxID=2870838 RepID=UPI001EEC5985|nr:family 16 glycosylhydrolase [Maribellus maritimus]MCG6186832.1 family 16 glycosylhydrolase [Maribellus maritimus]